MGKASALEDIRITWNNANMDLGKKIDIISAAFYSSGLDLATTAAFIKATPSELDALLSLGEYDEEILDMLSELNPPKTTWTLLANANEDEIVDAIEALKDTKDRADKLESPISEYIFQRIIESSGPTKQQKIRNLTGDIIKHVLKKGADFNVISEWEKKFLKSIAGQKKSGRVLSEKQVDKLEAILKKLVDNGAIKRDSIDGDQEICNQILDALEE